MVHASSLPCFRHAVHSHASMLETLVRRRPGLWSGNTASCWSNNSQRIQNTGTIRHYHHGKCTRPGDSWNVRVRKTSPFLQQNQYTWRTSHASTNARPLTATTRPCCSPSDDDDDKYARRNRVSAFAPISLTRKSDSRQKLYNRYLKQPPWLEQRRFFKPTLMDCQEQGPPKSNKDSPHTDPDQQQPAPATKPRPTPLLRRAIKVPQYGPDADKAVRSLQNARKERAHAKTAANVRRALYGNLIICASKFGAWLSSGSSSMMSEFVHSVVDCGNQALLLMGLRDSRNVADRRHPYGYGKSVYFWALVSALGTFFLGAGVSMSHAVGELMEPSLSNNITSEVWAVLAMSFLVDGYVLYKTVSEIREDQPSDNTFWQYVQKVRDPATLAVLLEDGAACLGIIIAIGGIGASHAYGNPLFDGIAGVGISCLLGGIGLALVRVNHRFLIGQGVEREILDGIENIIKSRRSIDHVSSIQSQWTGPETFSFKAEVDFDGTYLSALLMPRYQAEFNKAREDLDGELQVLLSWYAEDVIRAIEREVRHVEAMIRQKYPGAEYIELEPMSKQADRFAIDDSFEEKLLLIEKEELQRLVRVLHEKGDTKPAVPESRDDSERPTKQ